MWMGGKKEGRMTCWMEERWKKVNISIEGRGEKAIAERSLALPLAVKRHPIS